MFSGLDAHRRLATRSARAERQHGHVVDYRHVIHSLRRKPMALLNLVYRDHSSPAEPSPWRSTPCSPVSARDQLAAPWLGFSARVRALLRGRTRPRVQVGLDDGVLPDLAALIERFRPKDAALPSSSSGCHPSPSTIRSRQALEKRHEDDRQDRRRPHRPAAWRVATARHQADLGRPGGDRRQGRLARRPLPGGPRRTGDGGAEPPSLRTASGGSAIAAGKDPRHVRLHRSADDLEGAGAGARRRRRLARKGSQSFAASGRPAPGNPISRRRSVWP